MKTNVMRRLDQAKIPYADFEYDTSEGITQGTRLCDKEGRERARSYKTLVTRGTELHVFVVPADHQLDLKKAARAAGEKKIEMIQQKELKPLTGYIHGGCSPIGMKKAYSTWLDASAEDLPLMAVSGGQIGVQVEIEPKALSAFIDAPFADLTVEDTEE